MKKLTIPLFAILCLFVLTGIAYATDVPEPESAEVPTFDLFAVQSTPAEGCDSAPTVALDGQEPTFTVNNNCGTCSPSSSCVGKSRGAACYAGSGQGWGSCDLYLGMQCSDGSGWDCKCYASGENIP